MKASKKSAARLFGHSVVDCTDLINVTGEERFFFGGGDQKGVYCVSEIAKFCCKMEKKRTRSQ